MPSQRRRNQVIIWGTQSRVEDERNNSNKTIINYLYYWEGRGGGGGAFSPSSYNYTSKITHDNLSLSELFL